MQTLAIHHQSSEADGSEPAESRERGCRRPLRDAGRLAMRLHVLANEQALRALAPVLFQGVVC